ncbi:hypothetical protein LXL04_026197 [Taraxacum kok-saghyz]
MENVEGEEVKYHKHNYGRQLNIKLPILPRDDKNTHNRWIPDTRIRVDRKWLQMDMQYNKKQDTESGAAATVPEWKGYFGEDLEVFSFSSFFLIALIDEKRLLFFSFSSSISICSALHSSLQNDISVTTERFFAEKASIKEMRLLFLKSSIKKRSRSRRGKGTEASKACCSGGMKRP